MAFYRNTIEQIAPGGGPVKAAQQIQKVDFPEPDSPMIATNEPRLNGEGDTLQGVAPQFPLTGMSS